MRIKLEQKHYQWGLTIFIVFILCALVFFALYRFEVVSQAIAFCVKVVSPFIYGLVMAYLLCPIYNLTVNKSYTLMNRGKYKFKHDMTFSKAIGSIISIAIILVVITGVLWMIIPGLIDSIVKIVDAFSAAMKQFSSWIDIKFAKLPVAKDTIDDWISTFTDSALDFAKNTLLPQTGSIAAGISTRVLGALGVVLNFIIGIIVCVYFLNIKDTLGAQSKKIIFATFKEDTANEILEGADFTNKTFGGFISGKIIDSIIIGIICFIAMSILGLEYSLLISCVIAITNIIPFFGPFIGAIPSALLLLMVNPMHSLYFLILIIVLQQFDGNVLGPKILGETTGLASFWVLFAILVGGGLFGPIGMVLGVPVFAVLYAYTSRALNKRLTKKGFSTDVNDYKVDKYRVNTKKKKKRFGKRVKKAEEKGDIENVNESKIEELTEEEIKQAEENGHTVMEATLVEYEDHEDKGTTE